jgi:lipopolysaccharide/colanic/teichoic acid biosynthesis glycosyltransferase
VRTHQIGQSLLAGLLILLALPVLAACAAAIALDSGRPILFRCRRTGRNGVEFDMLKFRKMPSDAAGPPLTAARDERFTRVGRWLAAWKLDELPQLINVLRGEMSFVGPRPEDPAFVAVAGAEFEEVLAIRPGITGLSQLAFARESEVLDREPDRLEAYVSRLLPQKLALDRLYAREQSLLLDLRIVLWTFISIALRRDVSVHRATGKLGLRRQRQLVPEQLAESSEAA